MDVITKNVSVQGGDRLLKLSLKQGEYLNIGDNIRVVYAGGAGKIPIMLSRVFRKKHRQRSKRFYGMNA